MKHVGPTRPVYPSSSSFPPSSFSDPPHHHPSSNTHSYAGRRSGSTDHHNPAQYVPLTETPDIEHQLSPGFPR